MSEPGLLLHLLSFGLIGLLPRIFFRRDGRLGLKWWLTALPFFGAPVLLVLAYFAGIDPIVPADWTPVLQSASVVPAVASIALISLTLGTHRIPLALWHQENDAPRHIVTYGAYSRIRHPFYAAFLLAFLGALAFFPHWGTLLTLVYAVAALNFTAAQEEMRLSSSEFGAEYREYVARTGRFLPPARGTSMRAGNSMRME